MLALLKFATFLDDGHRFRLDFSLLTLVETVKYVEDGRSDFAVDAQSLAMFSAFGSL